MCSVQTSETLETWTVGQKTDPKKCRTAVNNLNCLKMLILRMRMSNILLHIGGKSPTFKKKKIQHDKSQNTQKGHTQRCARFLSVCHVISHAVFHLRTTSKPSSLQLRKTFFCLALFQHSCFVLLMTSEACTMT